MDPRAHLLSLLSLRAAHSGTCVMCGRVFWLWQLTSRFACSYLCCACADDFELELRA